MTNINSLLNTHSQEEESQKREEHKKRIRKNQVVLGFKNFLTNRPPPTTPIQEGNEFFRLRKLGYRAAQHYYETGKLILEDKYINHETLGHKIPDMCKTLDKRRSRSSSIHDQQPPHAND